VAQISDQRPCMVQRAGIYSGFFFPAELLACPGLRPTDSSLRPCSGVNSSARFCVEGE
jgi:hypothetical protein